MKRLALLSAVTAGSLLAAIAGPLVLGSALASSTLPTITIALNGTSITVGGALQSGAVNVASTTTVEKEGDPILFRLNPGVSSTELYAFLETKGAKDPNAASKYGSIVFDAEAPKGVTSEVQTSLQAGQYVALDSNGRESAKWPRASFTVQSAAAPATLPTPEATIRAIEFGFRGPTTLHDGELVRFENEGYLVHMDVAAQVKNMKTAKKLVKALLAGSEKKAEKLTTGGVGFTGPLSPGGFQQETISAKPGVYVQACFMDTQDGRSHTQLGMERIITITK
jgi:hypothetical protein